MYKSLKLSGGLLAGLTVGIASLSTTADAATWHKGTPKVLRGNWIYHRKQVSQWGYFHISSNKMLSDDQGMPGLTYKHLKYKSLGHEKYKIRSYSGRSKGTMVKWAWGTTIFVKRHGKIKVNGYTPWYHRGWQPGELI
ncbi:MAG: hypothetical protein DUD35_14220 [Lactobacillus sp.]|nr:MAG: hypothetical protein DUD35_14220 [Lactobacillus sp.]